MLQAWEDILEVSGIVAALSLVTLITLSCWLAMKLILGLSKTAGDLFGERMDTSESPEMETKTHVESPIWVWFQLSEDEILSFSLD